MRQGRGGSVRLREERGWNSTRFPDVGVFITWAKGALQLGHMRQRDGVMAREVPGGSTVHAA